MPKNTAAPTGPALTGRRTTGIVPTGTQNNDAMASPNSKSSEKTPNLSSPMQTRRSR